MQPRLHRRCQLRHQRQNIFALIAGEWRQDEISEVFVNPFSLLVRPDANPQARVVSSLQRSLDALEPVVATRAPARPDPDPTNGQLDFIDCDQQILRRTPERASYK